MKLGVQAAKVAMILEFVTYNGNMDMFTHARVKFELQPTGWLALEVTLQGVRWIWGARERERERACAYV